MYYMIRLKFYVFLINVVIHKQIILGLILKYLSIPT